MNEYKESEMKRNKKQWKKLVINVGIGFICIIAAAIGSYIGKYHPEWTKLSYLNEVYVNSNKLVNDVNK